MIITNIEKSLYFCFTHSSKFHLKKQELIKTEFISRANLVTLCTLISTQTGLLKPLNFLIGAVLSSHRKSN